MIELADILTARDRIAGRVHRTPTLSARSLGELAGVRLHLKAELLQKTGSFKVRGVLNKLLAMDPAERSRGLVSLSAGNHAAALAWGASAVGTTAAIVMPATAVPSKIDATRGYGGEVVLTEGNLLDTCLALQKERGLTLVHPFDDPLVIAGHGTIGLELLEDLPNLEVVLVPVGGGGLLSGIAAAIKGRRPDTWVVGVEPTGADIVYRSLKAGKPLRLETGPKTVADGLAAPFAGEHTQAQIQRDVDEIVLVEDEAILHALKLIVERAKLVPEPAGAAAFAALLAGAVKPERGAVVVCVVSGGNVDPPVLKRIL
ncbi:MAG: pyridoxal-phosphate dependent enzyme [Gemmatimonadetes bacterium]|nr:pyridoxal-phosphate dependent enzyme [Gemmatimonadota bacterium]